MIKKRKFMRRGNIDQIFFMTVMIITYVMLIKKFGDGLGVYIVTFCLGVLMVNRMIKTKGYEIKNKEIILKDIHRELNIENILYITVPGVEFEEIKSVENKEIGFIICKGEMIPVDLGLRDKKGNNLIHVLKVNYDIPYKFTEHGHIYLS